MNFSMAIENSSKLTTPSPLTSTSASKSFHLSLSSSPSSPKDVAVDFLEYVDVACFFFPRGLDEGSALLNSLMSMFPSPLVSNVQNAYVKFSFVIIFWWLTAAVKNSWKSILPSPSRSHFLRISSHFLPILNFLSFFSAALISSQLRLPSWLVSMLMNYCFRRLRSTLSALRPSSTEKMVFWNFENFAKFCKFCRTSVCSSMLTSCSASFEIPQSQG